MHHCPDCGQACYCHGDIDDCEVETPEYAAKHCVCAFDRVNGCGAETVDHDEYVDLDDDEQEPTT